MSKQEQYSGFKICSNLDPSIKCFRFSEYEEGSFNEIFHEHVPKHRISGDNAFEFMKTLVLCHSDFGDSEILRTYINKRGKSPMVIDFGHINVEWPESGVFRKYFSGGKMTVRYDEVVSKSDFRTENE